jgi:hypothetical protein
VSVIVYFLVFFVVRTERTDFQYTSLQVWIETKIAFERPFGPQTADRGDAGGRLHRKPTLGQLKKSLIET